MAVIGAGPAGISCAHELAQEGFEVTILETSERVGGMLCQGVPEYRLPRSLVELEARELLRRGVRIAFGERMGEHFSAGALLQEGFSAVFVAVGTSAGRQLDVPGVELDGVLNGIEFLLNVNRGYAISLGPRVGVIGGGDVAVDVARVSLRVPGSARPPLIGPREQAERGAVRSLLTDAARSAVRLGAREVHVFSLERREEMPAHESEVEEAEEEGITFHGGWGIRRFLGEEGRLTAAELVEVESVFDENGAFAPTYRPGTETLVPLDSVILAVGQMPDRGTFALDPELGLRPNGTIPVDPETLETRVPGVFAGGDIAFGPRNVIEAVADGRRAARAIAARFGRGREGKAAYRFRPATGLLPPVDCLNVPRQKIPSLPLARRMGFQETELVYGEEDARREAERCLHCHVNTIIDSSRCILCGGCVDVCPQFCYRIVSVDGLDAPADLRELGRRLSGGRESPTGEVYAIIKDDELCIRCGMCADRCPADAITMEVLEIDVPQR